MFTFYGLAFWVLVACACASAVLVVAWLDDPRARDARRRNHAVRRRDSDAVPILAVLAIVLAAVALEATR